MSESSDDYVAGFDAGMRSVLDYQSSYSAVAPFRSEVAGCPELRVTDPETGGMKGQKLARFSSIPQDVLWELAEHFGKGESKYPNDPETGQPNWQRGYDWRLNVDALQRHLSLWIQGEDFDAETGSSHLIAVVWHAMVLRWFEIHNKGKDFR